MQTQTTENGKAPQQRAPRKNAITGVLVDRLSDRHMRAQCARLGIDAEGASTEQVAVLLDEHFKRVVENGAQSVQCTGPTGCLGWSVIEEGVETCPYCNDGQPAEGGDEPIQAGAADEVEEAVAAPTDDEESAEIPVVEETEDGEPVAASPDIVEPAKDPTEVNALDMQASHPEAVPEPKPAAKAKRERKPKAAAAPKEEKPVAPVAVHRSNGASAIPEPVKLANGDVAVPGESRALVATPKNGLAHVPHVEGELLTEATLDRKIADYRAAEAEGWLAWRKQGLALGDIFGPELWKLRDPAKAKYKSFEQFVRAEIGQTAGNIYDWIKAAKYFDEETAKALGKSKCILIAQLSPEKRKEVVHAALAGKVKTPQLKEAVKADNKARGAGVGGKVTTRAGVTRTQKGGTKAQAKISIAQVVGKEQVKLFASTKDGEVTKTRALKLSQSPVGRSTSINGIVETFRVAQSPNGLVLVIERKRAEE